MSLKENAKKLFGTDKPFAITMWEFSWIERRWPGAGYEDWDKALNELVLRGYNAVRIDAFPHLVSKDIDKVWTIYPVWNTQMWGSPSINRICLKDDFRIFLSLCRKHGIKVALSSWFRQDEDHSEMDIKSPEDLADIWIKTIKYIEQWGELDNILYVDLCNEFPQIAWAPFLRSESTYPIDGEITIDWMKRASIKFKSKYPNIPLTFSFTSRHFNTNMDVTYLDFLELHIWMANSSDYYKKVGYNYERFDDTGYKNIALYGKNEFLNNKEYYENALISNINEVADWAKKIDKPIVTTECWSLVDYKDGPLFDWDWILDLNQSGVESAVKTGCWAGMATSNFCGPQFTGMWREISWHQNLTKIIKSADIINNNSGGKTSDIGNG